MPIRICEHCGARVNGNTCEYCDMSLTDNKTVYIEPVNGNTYKNAPDRNQFGEFNLKKIMLVIVILLSGRFAVHSIKNSQSSKAVRTVTSSVVSSDYSHDYSDTRKNTSCSALEISKENGIFNSGTYKIGEDIPEGTYLFIADGGADNYAHTGVYADYDCNEKIDSYSLDGWFENSKILKLDGSGYVKFSNSTAFDISKNDVKNSPFEHSGMFLVGRDLDAGTYKIVPEFDEGYAQWFVYSDITTLSPVPSSSGFPKYDGKDELTVANGEYIELSGCKLSK